VGAIRRGAGIAAASTAPDSVPIRSRPDLSRRCQQVEHTRKCEELGAVEEGAQCVFGRRPVDPPVIARVQRMQRMHGYAIDAESAAEIATRRTGSLFRQVMKQPPEE
jgi:hypothetical protein